MGKQMKIKYLYYGVVLLLIILAGISYLLMEGKNTSVTVTNDLYNDSSESNSTGLVNEEEVDGKEPLEVKANTTIYVYMCGEIKKPDVYEVSEGIRLFEVIEIAGGFSENAAKEALNLARKVNDQEQIYVPSIADIEEGYVVTSMTMNDGVVSINNADKETLMTLPGIGESKAMAIIDYRNTYGAFKAIEDIMNVSGIKENLFNQIKKHISL